MPSKNIIEIENLHKSYSGHKALEDINLNIKKSKIFGLLGPNGAGKTTLIRIINQIMKPDSGTIKFDGEILSRKHVYSIGYLPEERGLYKKMKVGEQALYLAQLKGLSKKEAKEKLNYWFEKLQVTNWWHKRIEDLSHISTSYIFLLFFRRTNLEHLILPTTNKKMTSDETAGRLKD